MWEDQILPHLAAIAILLSGPAGESRCGNCGLAQLTGPDGAAALIDQLRSGGTVLTYDPVSRTLRAGPSPSAGTTDTLTRTGIGGTSSQKKETEHPPQPEAGRG